MTQNFKWMTGDVNWADYGGKWYRHVRDRLYHVLVLENWENLVGADAEDGPKYLCELDVVDLGEIPADVQWSALRSVGIKTEFGIPEEMGDPELVRLEACHSHGAKAPLWSTSGDNFRKLMTAARRLSRELEPAEAHAAAMKQPVNAIGSTATEYMKGDVQSAILRGVAKDDDNAKLLLKLGVH